MFILILTCSAIDSFFKDIVREVSSLNSKKTMAMTDDYVKIVLPYLKGIQNYNVVFNSSYSFKPWEIWTESIAPKWWTAYNHIKHDRCEKFCEATLENCIEAIGGFYEALFFYEGFLKFGTVMTNAHGLFMLGGNT